MPEVALPVVHVDSAGGVGGTLLGLAVQGLSWLAFGFCLCGGWHAAEWLIHKI